MRIQDDVLKKGGVDICAYRNYIALRALVAPNGSITIPRCDLVYDPDNEKLTLIVNHDGSLTVTLEKAW